MVLRVLLAVGLGGALGIEREIDAQPAGFRTHILICLGAALFGLISIHAFAPFEATRNSTDVQIDVTRVASQVVVGIGFLGGGAILKYGASIRGLTTAASLWVTAAVGTAVGVGALLLGTVTTGITLIALVGLRPLRSLFRRFSVGREEFLVQAHPAVDVERLVDAVRTAGAALLEMRITEEGEERT